MATYKIYAEKTDYLEIAINARTRADANRIADELITDDFTQVNTTFRLVDIVQVYGAEVTITPA